MTPEAIAAICHEANRRYCRELGDSSQKPWEGASWSQQQSALAGVILLMQNPEATDSFLHESWAKRKKAEGWRYGPEKNEEAKEHPCLVPYEQLPFHQQQKDALFRSIVLALTQGENHGTGR